MKLSSLRGAPVSGMDGLLGELADLQFDSRRWKVGALLVRLDATVNRDTLLLPMERLLHPRPGDRAFRAPLWRQELRGDAKHLQVRASPFACTGEQLVGCRVNAADGPCGRIVDVVVDERWRVLGFLAEPGPWMNLPPALIAPKQLETVDLDGRVVATARTRRELARARQLANAGLRAAPG